MYSHFSNGEFARPNMSILLAYQNEADIRNDPGAIDYRETRVVSDRRHPPLTMRAMATLFRRHRELLFVRQ
jgi:hypothetical protein